MDNSRVRIWDSPLRVFHWGFASLFAIAWLTRGDSTLDIHVFAGYLFTALLGFRLLWGFAGEKHARFRSFLFGWKSVAAHISGILNKSARRYPGHNPAGSWAIFAMLALGALIALTGILTLGIEERHGPFSGLTGFDQGAALHPLHEILAWSLAILVGLHLAGVAFESLLHRENLAKSMLNGFKQRLRHEQVEDARPHTNVALAMLVGILLFSAWWSSGYLTAPENALHPLFSSPALPSDPLWSEECGDCHMVYHPSLLPARSWKMLLDRQDDHFGEDLSLDPDTLHRLQAFARANSAESMQSEAAWKILRGIPAGETPLRITRTEYWRDKHAGIPDATWRNRRVNARFNCDACHQDAVAATFEDSAITIPGT